MIQAQLHDCITYPLHRMHELVALDAEPVRMRRALHRSSVFAVCFGGDDGVRNGVELVVRCIGDVGNWSSKGANGKEDSGKHCDLHLE